MVLHRNWALSDRSGSLQGHKGPLGGTPACDSHQSWEAARPGVTRAEGIGDRNSAEIKRQMGIKEKSASDTFTRDKRQTNICNRSTEIPKATNSKS